jgi:dTDP-glucose 4,6-dehydratase
MSDSTIIITGGAGFIGSNLVRHVYEQTDYQIVVVDKLTYAGNLASVEDLLGSDRVRLEQVDIADADAMAGVFNDSKPDYLINMAAETHVDRSIDDAGPFMQSNIIGVYVLLELARQRFLDKPDFRMVHVSTDEVYGSLGADGLFSETTSYAPNSPYAASKASADHLVRAWFRTHGVPAMITNCSNNYGPYQFPEKLIPLMVLNAVEARALPVYGDGQQIRDWLYVEDHCSGVLTALQKGRPGENYNIGGNNEYTNLDIVRRLCAEVEMYRPASDNPSMQARGLSDYEELIVFVDDRPGHDRRYAIDAGKIRHELGWQPAHDVVSGMARTVQWYLDHPDWCAAVTQDNYQRQRLGLAG